MSEPLNILVVEDQTGPLESLSFAIRTAVFEEKIRRFSETPEKDLAEKGVDIARCYSEAEKAVENSNYHIIFLDHRLPYNNQTELERKDFDAFCKTLGGRGYCLIPRIRQKNPQTVVIGTSSLHADELREFGKPDYRLDKTGIGIAIELSEILEKMKGAK